MNHWALWLAWLLAALFLLNSVANLSNLKPLKEEFERWRLPWWFRFLNAAWQTATAIFIVRPQTVEIGLAMGFAICVGIVVIVGIRAREFGHCIPAIVLAAMLIAVAVGPK